MSTAQIFTFNDLNNFCDQIIAETQRWREVLAIQTEEYMKLAKNNEDACAKVRFTPTQICLIAKKDVCSFGKYTKK